MHAPPDFLKSVPEEIGGFAQRPAVTAISQRSGHSQHIVPPSTTGDTHSRFCWQSGIAAVTNLKLQTERCLPGNSQRCETVRLYNPGSCLSRRTTRAARWYRG